MEKLSTNRYPFYFKVTCFDSLTEDYAEHTETGFGIAHSYSEAVTHLEKYFGEEIESIDKLMLLQDGDLILFPEEVCNKFLNGDY